MSEGARQRVLDSEETVAYPEVWSGAKTMLKVEDIHVAYGRVEVLHGVSLEVTVGEVVVLLGSNGAGKTTTMNTISGLLKPSRGSITFEATSITGMEASKVVSSGISQVPQGRKVFSNQSVYDNLVLGAYSRRGQGGIKEDIEDAFGRFPVLGQRRNQAAGTLSGGEQQMLAISRAMMSRPKLLILDEPSVGLAPLLVKSIFDTVRELNKKGTTILLVEQLAFVALEVADRGYVLERGRIVLSGTATELLNDPDVKAAYLGGT